MYGQLGINSNLNTEYPRKASTRGDRYSIRWKTYSNKENRWEYICSAEMVQMEQWEQEEQLIFQYSQK